MKKSKVLVLFVLVAVSVLSIVFAVFYVNTNTSPTDSAASAEEQQQILNGFNTQLRLGSSNLNLTAFRNLLTDIKSQNIHKPIVRLSIGEIFPRTDNSTFTIDCSTTSTKNCDPALLEQYRSALSEAYSQGIKISLVVGAPSFATTYSTPAASETFKKKYTQTEYKTLISNSFDILSKTFAPYVDIWNLFNEADIYTFDTHTPIIKTDFTNYLATYKEIFSTAYAAVKKNDANSLVTTDIAGLERDDEGATRRNNYIAKIIDKLDIVSFNLYPWLNETQALRYPDQIKELKTKYGKPVSISETGICGVGVSEQDRTNYIFGTIRLLKKSGIHSIMAYQYQDDSAQTEDECQRAFGIIDKDGKKKQSYTKVVEALKTVVFDDKTELEKVTVKTCNPSLFGTSFLDEFNYDGTMDWSKWSAASRAMTYSQGILAQNRNDWMISSTKLNGNFEINLNIKAMVSDGTWSSSTLGLKYTNGKEYKMFILKEKQGYSLNLTDGVTTHRYALGGERAKFYSPSLVSRDGILFMKVDGVAIGLLGDAYFKNIPSVTTEFSVITEGSTDNSKIEVRLDSVFARSCN